MAMIFPPLPGLPLPFRLRGIGVQHHQEAIHRPHGYPHHQWIQVRSGSLRLTAASVTAVARPGDGLYLRPDETHSYAAETTATVDWMCFDGEGVENALVAGPLTRSGVYRLADTAAIDRIFDSTWEALAPVAGSSGSTSAQRLSALVYDLLMALTDAAALWGQTSAAADLGRLGPVLQALAHRPAHDWDLEALAALIGVSPQHLRRVFRRALGQAPLEYLTRLRLNRALRLLIERPDLRVHEVGSAVGYDDPKYFIRLFRRQEGRTPGEFRRLHGQA